MYIVKILKYKILKQYFINKKLFWIQIIKKWYKTFFLIFKSLFYKVYSNNNEYFDIISGFFYIFNCTNQKLKMKLIFIYIYIYLKVSINNWNFKKNYYSENSFIFFLNI